MNDEPDDDSEPPQSRARLLVGLLLMVVLIGGGLFIWHKVVQMAATQDCVASGRHDCL